MQQNHVRREYHCKQRQLRRHEAADVALAEPQDRRREAGIIHGAVRDAFRKAPKQRQRAERDDQRRNAEHRDERRVQRAARTSDGEGHGRRGRRRPSPVARRSAEHHGRESHHGADRQVDAAGDDNGRHRYGEQADFHAQPHHFERVRDAEKIRSDRREDGHLDRNGREERPARSQP
jgi:hypothetical protein